MDFPPPHRVLYEPLNDRETLTLWKTYTAAHRHEAQWFNHWITFVPSRVGVRVRILMVWHAHFLSLACQQMLRRSLEQRSFRCRVWFHIEEPTLQAAILSRCIVKVLPRYQHIPKRIGPPLDTALWDNPREYETNRLKSRE